MDTAGPGREVVIFFSKARKVRVHVLAGLTISTANHNKYGKSSFLSEKSLYMFNGYVGNNLFLGAHRCGCMRHWGQVKCFGDHNWVGVP